MLKEKEKVVNNFLAIVDVFVAWVAFNLSMCMHYGEVSPIPKKDSIILHFLILLIWFVLSKLFRLNELYRSRPYSVLMVNVVFMTLLGSAILVLAEFTFGLNFIGLEAIAKFAALVIILEVILKISIYAYLKNARTKGLNTRTVLIVGDITAKSFIEKLVVHKEWGYRIVGVIGDEELKSLYGDKVPFLPLDSDIDVILAERTIDEVIYMQQKARMEDIMSILTSCSEVGVVFRMSSPFFNVLSNKTHLHYFDTTPLLTISNTPIDYLALKAKAIFDFTMSFFAIVILSPVYLCIALLIKLSSKGPIFFKQKRVGLRGRKYWVYKFRTMVTNAEDLMAELAEFNEMDGPTFKMTRDPRITNIGHFLRKTSLDELPQFFNVLMGDMSIVGPRPPVPSEVKEYERWQLRRLSMKPGITCIWQVSSSRNSISFDDWMKMDLEYIDNWSLSLDFVIILKTIRTMVRADGK